MCDTQLIGEEMRNDGQQRGGVAIEDVASAIVSDAAAPISLL